MLYAKTAYCMVGMLLNDFQEVYDYSIRQTIFSARQINSAALFGSAAVREQFPDDHRR